MALRNVRSLTFRPRTLSDTIDGTNVAAGAMQALQNLVPSPTTRDQWVPRPAATLATSFAGFTSPTTIEALFAVGETVYGMIASGLFPGKSQPFIYNVVTGAFTPISGETLANLPNSAPTVGDWTPPTITRVGGYVLFTHPGFTGANGRFFGWLDMTGLSLSSLTGNTSTSVTPTVITNLSANPIDAGVQPGQRITGTGIPAGATVVSVTGSGTTGTITISASVTATNTGVALTIAGGSPSAPLWASGNLNINPLPSVPVAVNQFNGRAYFAVGSAVQMSDAGQALQCTNTNGVQVVTFQNGAPVTALSSLPFTNLQGGIVQALIIFQGTDAIQQITGDPTTSNLAVNLIQHGTGTLAPNAIDITPEGLVFIAPDGLRLITLLGTVTPVLGSHGEGVALPFVNAAFPSRMSGGYNTDVYRVAIQTLATPASIWGQAVWGQALWGAGQIVTQEYWYHFKLKAWSGPHTFPVTQTISLGGISGFAVAAPSLGPGLYLSQVIPSEKSVYTENNQPMQCVYRTSLLPDTEQMSENELAQLTVGLGAAQAQSVSLSIVNEAGTTLDSVTLAVNGGGAAIWDQFVWGSASWGVGATVYFQYQVFWNQPVIFKQAQLQVGFIASAGMIVGNLYMSYRQLGYVIQGVGNAA